MHLLDLSLEHNVMLGETFLFKSLVGREGHLKIHGKTSLFRCVVCEQNDVMRQYLLSDIQEKKTQNSTISTMLHYKKESCDTMKQVNMLHTK